MTKFLAYINEGRTKTISPDKAYLNIINNCSKNYKKIFNSISSTKIYRGMPFNDDFGYIDSNKGKERQSANTDNYYTLLFDNLPSWKEWPKRSRGVVCSTDKNYSDRYGNVFYIVPYDNAKIGVCSSFDIWESFHNKEFWKVFSDLDEFNYTINKIISKSSMKKTKPKNYDQLKDILIQISNLPDDEWMNLANDKEWKFFKQRDIMKHLNDVLSPSKNGFKMGIENIKPEREVWIQGKVILMSNHGHAMILEDLHKHFWG